jgi:hypothetical protein
MKADTGVGDINRAKPAQATRMAGWRMFRIKATSFIVLKACVA